MKYVWPVLGLLSIFGLTIFLLRLSYNDGKAQGISEGLEPQREYQRLFGTYTKSEDAFERYTGTAGEPIAAKSLAPGPFEELRIHVDPVNSSTPCRVVILDHNGHELTRLDWCD